MVAVKVALDPAVTVDDETVNVDNVLEGAPGKTAIVVEGPRAEPLTKTEMVCAVPAMTPSMRW